MDKAEEQVARFYNGPGWKTRDGVTEDARRWEDLRPGSACYVSESRRRVGRHIPAGGHRFLDMASGPIQYDEYLDFSRGFAERHCVDLSAEALAMAEAKIGSHGVYHCGSFLTLPFDENAFDCTISLHTIYHIEADRQEEAVRKLLRVTKPGAPVIIVYSNPDALTSRLKRRVDRIRGKAPRVPEPDLYFRPHPLDWWSRFGDTATIEMRPWRAFEATEMRRLIPGGPVGALILRVLFRAEDAFPGFFVRNGRYPMIILRKR